MELTQARYAGWLAWGTRVGLVLLVLGFAAYMLGASPHVPIDRLPELWQRPAAELLAATGTRPGWAWAALLPRSDMAVLAAIALLATCSILALAAAMAAFARGSERALAVVCALEILVLLLAASGLLAVH